MRIIEKLQDRIEQGKLFYSLEYFPPKTDVGLMNLYPRIERMAGLRPCFVDITWGAGGSTSEKTLEISANLQRLFGLDVLMHLTCTNMPKAELDGVLDKVYEAGIRNILALRGDPPHEHGEWESCEGGFSYAHELVSHIRKRFGDEMCIGVAGYPEGHLEAPDRDVCVRHLKHKIDCGADFVVTQLFFDVDEYATFLERCKAAGITCPIIPGILPIQSYDRFKQFTEFTGVKVPPEVWKRLEPIRQNDADVRAYGVELAIDICQRLVELGVPGLHFYTLNLQSSTQRIIEGLECLGDARQPRPLPWRASAIPDRRTEEDVRPIFWSNRPKSYMARTMEWDEFPNGRWGDRGSPSFGNLHDYYLLRRGMGLSGKAKKLRRDFGEPTSLEDVTEVFVKFCKGAIHSFPWVDGDIQSETQRISDELVALNTAGYLTINSQPPVNGALSTDPDVGWGGEGGVVFQKSYLELFLSPEKLDAFLAVVPNYPSLTYQAVNVQGEVRTNLPETSVNAVTWGVFPGREILQPTVVDYQTFLIWKDEAFHLWKDEWGALYEPDSPSRKLLEDIHDSYWLMNLVENDFVEGDLFAIFRELGVIEESPEATATPEARPATGPRSRPNGD